MLVLIAILMVMGLQEKNLSQYLWHPFVCFVRLTVYKSHHGFLLFIFAHCWIVWEIGSYIIAGSYISVKGYVLENEHFKDYFYDADYYMVITYT